MIIVKQEAPSAADTPFCILLYPVYNSNSVTASYSVLTAPFFVVRSIPRGGVSDGVSDKPSEGSGDDSSSDGTFPSVSSSNSTPFNVTAVLAAASSHRSLGKASHDEGSYEDAASHFRRGANSVSEAFSSLSEVEGGGGGAVEDSDLDSLAEEYATCRIHEALCHLKSSSYESASECCSDALGESSSPLAADEGEGEGDAGGHTRLREGLARISTPLRARAFYRRAKAKKEMGLDSDAVEDAKAGGFLGDQRSLEMYGRLMREQ
eukprot:CAMPEP_0182453140 /NCGR_PEP_ID=MMETSP1319-20130603/327_1 /TAXON_ID=172717 /ORGANISM="Bolidomonas pacifica, Strain RCC208" /LENGTH=263 /DNA_ID=CAMNT_0024651035 /DNA_START=127 /DNA_END=915 /DNA_ORIENTATION=-